MTAFPVKISDMAGFSDNFFYKLKTRQIFMKHGSFFADVSGFIAISPIQFSIKPVKLII